MKLNLKVGGKPWTTIMLRHKEDKLIAALKKVVIGNESSYIPYHFDNEWERHYQIWFYDAFDFNYIFIGQENFVVNVSDKDDDILVDKLRKTFFGNQNQLSSNLDNDFIEYLKEKEFEFFAGCWDRLQNELGQNFRCFLIEYGIIRGFDVNLKLRVDGEKIGKILVDEHDKKRASRQQ